MSQLNQLQNQTKLEPFILTQLNHLNLNVSEKLNIIQIEKSNSKNQFGDRFILNFPFCQSIIPFNIIYSSLHETYPPDIILPFNFIDLRKLKSFKEYNYLESSSLTKCIIEIKNEFIEFNKLLVSNHQNETIQFHFNTLLDILNVEYFIKITIDQQEEIKIKIPLKIKNLDLFLKEKNKLNTQNLNIKKKQDLNCYFYISFNEKNEVLEYEIIIPNSIKDYFKYLPNWRSDSYLLDYVSILEEKINEEINKHFLTFDLKKEFINQLSLTLGILPLDYDRINFNTVSYLFNQDDFYFILFLTFDKYPNECPIVQIQSTQYSDKKSNSIIRCKLKSIKYEKENKIEEKIRIILSHVADTFPFFQQQVLQ
eukprot:gene2295-2468_t